MARGGGLQVRRSQVERREESDKLMLRSAIKLIARQGVGNTTLAEVGLAAGYSRGLPIDRFGSKIGLVEAVLKSMEVWFDEQLSTSLREMKGLDAVKARIKAHLDSARKSPEGLTALFSIYIESLFGLPEILPQIKRVMSGWRRGLIKNIREGQEMNEIRLEIDCNQQATIILGMLRGLQIDYLLGDRSAGLDAMEAALDVVIKEMISAKYVAKQTTPQRKPRAIATKSRPSR